MLNTSYPTLHIPVLPHKKPFGSLLVSMSRGIASSFSIFPLVFVTLFFCPHNHDYTITMIKHKSFACSLYGLSACAGCLGIARSGCPPI